jgi:hypothetical protein
VGTGARAELYVRALTRGAGALAGFADVSPARMAAHNELVNELGGVPVPQHPAEDFLRMPDEQDIDTVIVTTVDRFHGGADARMLQDIFMPGEDHLGRRADHRDGALSLLTGFAANQSVATGEPVKVADLPDLR